MANDVMHIATGRYANIPNRVFFDIMTKFRLVCGLPQISENFIRWMDDVYLLNNFRLSQFNYLVAQEDFSNSDIDGITFKASLKWSTLMKKTLHLLRSLGRPQYSYSTHLPRKFNKTYLLTIMKQFNIPVEIQSIDTLYFNMLFNKPDIILTGSQKLKKGLYDANFTAKQLQELKGYTFLNNGTSGYTPELKLFLKNKFPNKSKFEK
jgi:uncharacterized membrane protein YciS (DUF1049 family)